MVPDVKDNTEEEIRSSDGRLIVRPPEILILSLLVP